MPAARQRSRSPSSAEAVIAMIGTRLAGRLPRRAPRGWRRSRPAAASGSPSAPRRSRAAPAAAVDRLDPVVGDLDRAAEVLQQAGRHELVDRVVLDDQHADAERRAAPRRRGRRRARRGRRATTPTRASCSSEWRTGLLERGVDARPSRAACGADALVGGEQQHRRAAPRSGSARDPAGQLEPVGARHHQVEQRDLERAAAPRRPRAARPAPRRPRRPRPARICQAASCSVEDEAVGLVVVDDEHPAAAQQLRGAGARGRAAPRGPPEARR